ncbi:MAG: hypothetical protein U0360_00085 [Dehalococcoidia bacterium]
MRASTAWSPTRAPPSRGRSIVPSDPRRLARGDRGRCSHASRGRSRTGAGFLRRFAWPRVVAVRTLRHGADLAIEASEGSNGTS